MDIELLRTFLEVNRVRHFGQAAEALHVTQAAVSGRIKQLETLLGVSLFDRTRREVKLTPEGHRLRRHAERMLADWRKARQEVTAGGARHQLSMSSSPRLWDILLQKWLIELRRQQPELAITTYSLGPDAVIRQLLDGVIDLAFLLDPPQLDVLQVREVAYDLYQALFVLAQVDLPAGDARLHRSLGHGVLVPQAPLLGIDLGVTGRQHRAFRGRTGDPSLP